MMRKYLLLLLLILSSATNVLAAKLGCDTFTNADGTVLNTHTSTDSALGADCPTGDSWDSGANVKIVSNRAGINGTDSTSQSMASMNITPPDNYFVSGVCRLSTAASTSNFSMVCTNRTDGATTAYCWGCRGGTSGNRKPELLEVVSGTATTLFTHSSATDISANTNYAIKLVSRRVGSNVELDVYWEGSYVTTITDTSPISGAGEPGIFVRMTATGNESRIDNFVVESLQKVRRIIIGRNFHEKLLSYFIH